MSNTLIFATRSPKQIIMGRIFEVRKATMFARWDRMAKQFTRIGKEIVIAVKAGGPDPATNPALRRCFQNARSVGMPKDDHQNGYQPTTRYHLAWGRGLVHQG